MGLSSGPAKGAGQRELDPGRGQRSVERHLGRRHGTHSEDRNAGLREPGRQGVLRARIANPALDGVAREAAVPRQVPPGADGRTSGAGTGAPLCGLARPAALCRESDEGRGPRRLHHARRRRGTAADDFHHAPAPGALLPPCLGRCRLLAGRPDRGVRRRSARAREGERHSDHQPDAAEHSRLAGARRPLHRRGQLSVPARDGQPSQPRVDAGLPGAAYRRRRSQRSGAAGVRNRRRCLCARNRPLPRSGRRRPREAPLPSSSSA